MVQEPHWAFCSRGKSYSTWGIELWHINCTACSPINIPTRLSWPVIWFGSYLQDMQIPSICWDITIFSCMPLFLDYAILLLYVFR